jgi:hypothetical protein
MLFVRRTGARPRSAPRRQLRYRHLELLAAGDLAGDLGTLVLVYVPAAGFLSDILLRRHPVRRRLPSDLKSLLMFLLGWSASPGQNPFALLTVSAQFYLTCYRCLYLRQNILYRAEKYDSGVPPQNPPPSTFKLEILCRRSLRCQSLQNLNLGVILKPEKNGGL